MKNNIANFFSYSESSFDLWEAMKEIYGSQNNVA